MTRTKVALVGIGKIALDQHVPALNASPDFELAATVSRSGKAPSTPEDPPQSHGLWTLLSTHPDTLERATALRAGRAPYCS